MNWSSINNPDGRLWRRTVWPTERFIWFHRLGIVIHWASEDREERYVRYDVEFCELFSIPAAYIMARDWEQVIRREVESEENEKG